MKFWMAALMLCLVSVPQLRAQPSSVTLELSLDQDQFLPGEEIRIAAKITNLSGQELELGQDDNWLAFFVESREKRFVEKYSNPPVAGAFSLRSATSGTKRVNIAPYYDMQSPGRYEVSAKVRIPHWNLEISSRPVTFYVTRGAKLRELEFGVPALEGEEQKNPQVRKYILQQTEYRREMKLYLRLTDAYEGKTYKLYPISRMMSFSRPEMHLDRFSNVHVLHQSGQNSFTYCTMNPFGQILNLQRHDYLGDSRPRLAMDEGRVIVRGGTRVVTENDIPPVHEVSSVDQPAPQDASQP